MRLMQMRLMERAMIQRVVIEMYLMERGNDLNISILRYMCFHY